MTFNGCNDKGLLPPRDSSNETIGEVLIEGFYFNQLPKLQNAPMLALRLGKQKSSHPCTSFLLFSYGIAFP